MRPTQQSESVLRRAIRSGTGAVCALVLVLLVAAPAWAARVTEVRVGRHDEFTRVVFELDRPSGYRLERVRGASGPELRVTLDAAARGQTIPFRTRGITKVVVEPGTSAVAHITLREEGTWVKEMILASPPRIVLDVMKANTVAVAKKPAPKPAPKVAKEPEPKPAPVAKEPEPKPAPVAKEPEPKPAPVAKKPEPKPAPVAKEPEPKPAPEVVKKAEPAPAPEVAKTPAPKPLPVQPEPPKPEPLKVAKAEPGPSPTPAPALSDPEEEAAEREKASALGLTLKGDAESALDSPEAAAEESEPAEKLAKVEPAKVVKPKPAPVPKAAKATTPAPAPTARSSGSFLDGSLFGVEIKLLAAAGAGVLLLLLGFVLMRRRRTLPNDLDVMAIADESGEGGTGSLMDQASHDPLAAMPDATSSADSGSPLSSLFDDGPEEPAHAATPPQPKAPPPPPSDGPALDDLFNDQAASAAANEPAADPNAATMMGDPTMNQGTSDLPADPDRMASTQSPIGSAAPDSDVLRVVHELERRMQQLESKLSEANEARERLERQVAAQSEELRVQRAAIARTQRALRTMSRGEEDKATEPALRDPNSDTQTQAKTRVATE